MDLLAGCQQIWGQADQGGKQIPEVVRAHGARHYLRVSRAFPVQNVTPCTDVRFWVVRGKRGAQGDVFLLPGATPAWAMCSAACSPRLLF